MEVITPINLRTSRLFFFQITQVFIHFLFLKSILALKLNGNKNLILFTFSISVRLEILGNKLRKSKIKFKVENFFVS